MVMDIKNGDDSTAEKANVQNLIAESERSIGAAYDEVIRICSVDERTRMSIPADVNRDTDLILSAALENAKSLVAALREAQATIEKIYEIRHRRITWHGLSVSEEAAIDAALAGALAGNALLSAPSSTGGGEKPKTVCLCGSTRFRAEIAEANRSLTMQGYMVLAPGVFGHDGDPLTDDDKMRLDKLHFSKIDASDRVHVVNPGGYIGESTRREIEYAKAKGKPVTYRHESSTGGNFRDDLKSRESRRSDVDFDTATNRPLGGDDHE